MTRPKNSSTASIRNARWSSRLCPAAAARCLVVRHCADRGLSNIAPLNVQVITQWPGRSTLEVERQLTVPVETALSGVPDAASIRSVSLFGLSV